MALINQTIPGVGKRGGEFDEERQTKIQAHN
jgi:hypothetical protein